MHDADREHLRELDRWLDRLLALPDGARTAALAACADARLREELSALLAHDPKDGPLDRTPSALITELLREQIDTAAPQAEQRIGAYTLRSLIAEGGSAAVWRAERSDGSFSQRVAVKCLKSGLATPASRARFLREQQILASLSHPCIAQLHDAGITPEGVPWIVMELVEGQTITQHCDTHGLDLRARLLLFRNVLDAVTCAQRNLIVHRDLKPANILATAEGVPKLLDFGIAKPLSESEATQTQWRALTPGYAAPEQFHGGAITTATDVYALGVVLHELLAGCKPQRSGETPLPPSQTVLRVEHTSDSQEAAVRRGFASAARLASALRGDLDTIVLTALHDEPVRRYDSASAMDEDIERFLQKRPLRARRDSRGYRARKFVQRNWLTVGALAAIVIALGIGIGVAAWQAHQARLAAARAQAAQDFLLGVFDAAQPDTNGGTSLITTREVADRAARELRERFGAGLDAEPRLLLSLAQVYIKMHVPEQAQPLLERALRLARAQASTNPAQLVDALEATALMQQDEGYYRQARNSFDQALRELAAMPPNPARAADLLINRARAEADGGDSAAADTTIAAARVQLAHLRNGSADLSLQAAMVAASSARAAGRGEDAVREAQMAARIAAGNFGAASPQEANAQGSLAASLRLTGRYAEAAAAQRRLLAIDRDTVHEIKPGHLYQSGLLLLDAGDYAGAEQAFRQALMEERVVAGDDASDLGSYEEGLGRALLLLGRSDEAATIACGAVARFERASEDVGGELAQARLTCAQAMATQDHADAARQRFQQVLTATAHAPNARAQRQRLSAQLEIAALDAAGGKTQSAVAGVQAALAQIGTSIDAPTCIAARIDASRILLSAGDRTGALSQAQSALELSSELPSDHPLRARAQLAQIAALVALGREENFRATLASALQVLAAKLSPTHPDLVQARSLAQRLGTNHRGKRPRAGRTV